MRYHHIAGFSWVGSDGRPHPVHLKVGDAVVGLDVRGDDFEFDSSRIDFCIVAGGRFAVWLVRSSG